ncbi:hypothetical protein [Microvirga aerophila]|uniref:Uncharacterized protein n=1 Tax=Microvirga aerophila TaxID=670291 RepID=A0A512C327_9HYPH|nr:hypothetical protein [Microvirga aerophila]GEO18615.1 hypothetical protein MAE02_63110 [Microvirga aerophila]
MAYSTARLEKYLDYVDRLLDVYRLGIREAPNGDHYLTFKVTTTNTRQEHLENKIITHINNAVDPDAYGVDTGPTGGKRTSTYTVILDESNHDIDLISGRYRDYHNDVAGISRNDAKYATQPGYPTPYLIDGVPFKIYPPHSTVLGQSIGDWAEEWWTWALQAPANPDTFEGNPLTDTTGEFAHVNNDGPVFFVAGAFPPFGPATVERSFAVEEGTPLLVPVVNNLWLATGGDTEADANAALDAWKASVDSFFFEIDGKPVENVSAHLEETDFFSPGSATPGSLLAALVPEPDPNEDFAPSRDAGYWLMIDDLPQGKHTLHFGGTAGGNTINVTDHIYIT